MLLSISTTNRPATDLGYLLHKNPARCQSFPLSFGNAHLFYPEAAEDRCTAALLLDVDPVGMVRGRGGISQSVLAQYVNDRPYVASSLMSVAIAQVLGPALDGRSKERPELAGTAIPLVASLQVLPCRGGETFLHDIFGPLGYEVHAVRYACRRRESENRLTLSRFAASTIRNPWKMISRIARSTSFGADRRATAVGV
jgi:3' terminal RNA ribose 2'-O-methyltransferase Hen1